jgi:glycine/D-amino acid oxidase-like deaminating enzyme
MTERPDSTETVVIVGGGIAGCSIAHRLAPDHDVLVLEQGQIAGEASGLAAGLTSASFALPDFPSVSKIVSEFYQEFDGTGNFEYHPRPRVGLLVDGLIEEKREEVEYLTDNGVPAAMHTPESIEAKYPRIDASGFDAAVEYQTHGWVDPYTLTTTYAEEAEKRGAEIHTGVAVEDIVVEDGAVTGVETTEGHFDADHVVSAVGWRSTDFLAEYVQLPVQPFLFQALSLDVEWDGDWIDTHPIVHAEHEGVYTRPELNGSLLVGDGFRKTDRPELEATGIDADEQFHEDVARVVPEMFTDLGDAAVVNDWAGVEGMTPDVQPIIDAPPEAPDGLVVVETSAEGFVGAPFISLGARCLITGEEAPFPLEAFGVDRFEDRSADWGLDRMPAYFEEDWDGGE